MSGSENGCVFFSIFFFRKKGKKGAGKLHVWEDVRLINGRISLRQNN